MKGYMTIQPRDMTSIKRKNSKETCTLIAIRLETTQAPSLAPIHCNNKILKVTLTIGVTNTTRTIYARWQQGASCHVVYYLAT